MKTLYVSDLDGTLLQKGTQSLNSDVISFIERLYTEYGIIFVAASGRQYSNLKRLFGSASKYMAFICENGDVLVMYKGEVKRGKKIESGTRYIDGREINGIDDSVIRDRKRLGSDGLISVVVPMDMKTCTMLKPPSIVSRGFIFLKERGELLVEAEKVVYSALTKLANTQMGVSEVKAEIKRVVKDFVYDRTQRDPIIIPVILFKKD